MIVEGSLHSRGTDTREHVPIGTVVRVTSGGSARECRSSGAATALCRAAVRARDDPAAQPRAVLATGARPRQARRRRGPNLRRGMYHAQC